MTDAHQERLIYCLSCGEEVPTYTVDQGAQVEVRCTYCGLPLEVAQRASDTSLECIIFADDDPFFRELLHKILETGRLAREVIACESGPALLTACVYRFRDQLPINLAILDIRMTPMDGPTAAVALRALEAGFDIPDPTPVLFLSAIRADETLRKLLSNAVPAFYLNKAADAGPNQLAERLKALMPRLILPQASQG
ncbi:MAG: response regulator [Candidatus Methylomirabilales bacterium]